MDVDTYDQFVGAEVFIPGEQGRKFMARVTKCVKENEDNHIWSKHPAMYSDQSLYEFSFPNGQTEELPANVIYENMLSQVDSEAKHYQVLNDIIDYYADGSALKGSN